MRYTNAYIRRTADTWANLYEIVNRKKAPTVFWANGWFSIDRTRYRVATLEKMTAELRRRAAEPILAEHAVSLTNGKGNDAT